MQFPNRTLLPKSPLYPQVQGLRISAKFAGNPGASIPLACGTPDRLKAAYRFFDNDKVSELEMLEPHGQARTCG